MQCIICAFVSGQSYRFGGFLRGLLFILSFHFVLNGAAIGSGFGDGSQIQKLCNDNRYSRACLTGLLSFHGAAYDGRVYAMGDFFDVARDASNIMDIKSTTMDGVVEYVAFESELLFLMKQPFTLAYLETLNEELGEAIQHHTRFRLWDFTVKATRGDTKKALWLLAVLFQDTSHHKVHFEYLHTLKDSKIPAETLAVLSDVLDLLDPDQLWAENHEEWLSLYPPMLPVGAERKFNTTMYHFYTISYQAMRLKWLTRQKKLAAFVPFLLDVSYKFRKLSDRWPLHPKKIDLEKEHGPLVDMYAAYVGTQWAVGATSKPPSFDEFSKGMSDNPLDYMKSLYQKQLRN